MTEIPIQQTEKYGEKQESSSSSEEVDFDPDDENQKFFNLAEVKPIDLKAKWLGDTNEVILRYQSKLSELHKQKVSIKEEFDRFAENQNRFKISSLRKINFVLDKQEIYNEFIKKTRRTIEKLHPSLVINICSYVSQSVFLALAKLRRVSKIFSIIYCNQNVLEFFSQRDFGVAGLGLKMQEKWCERYTYFKQTFLYYKQIKYTVLIPQNSIKEDIERAVEFINEVYKRCFAIKNTDFGYFHLVNRFMRHHRIVLALEALTFTDMAVTKKASIVAFSNYLAFNASARQKDQITKTKYMKMIHMVEDEHYRDSLFINSKISNFLQDEYQFQFAVFIDTLKTANKMDCGEDTTYDLVVYHMHNQLRSSFSKGLVLTEDPIQVGEVTLMFTMQNFECSLSYPIGNRLQTQVLSKQYLPTLGKDHKFGQCYIYRGQFYYVLLIKGDPVQPGQQ